MSRYTRSLRYWRAVTISTAMALRKGLWHPLILGVSLTFSLIWRSLRPTICPALRANWKMTKSIDNLLATYDTDEKKWREILGTCPREERDIVVTSLLALFESDRSRERGIESKARGVVQTAGLVFAGIAVALNLTLRQWVSTSPIVVVLLMVSAFYLFTAVGAALYVEKPGERKVLSPEDTLSPEQTGATLAVATILNRTASISRTNLTESAIFDVARSLVAATVALLITVVGT